MTVEVRWSELQRGPKGVAALADRGDVRVRRRHGAALLLTRVDRASSTAEGTVAVVREIDDHRIFIIPAVKPPSRPGDTTRVSLDHFYRGRRVCTTATRRTAPSSDRLE